MSEALVSAVVQVPILGVFIWYVLQQQREARAERAETLKAMLGTLGEMTAELKSHSEKIETVKEIMIAHDAKMTEAARRQSEAMQSIQGTDAHRTKRSDFEAQ